MQAVLIHKPDDVYVFAQEFFAPFAQNSVPKPSYPSHKVYLLAQVMRMRGSGSMRMRMWCLCHSPAIVQKASQLAPTHAK